MVIVTISDGKLKGGEAVCSIGFKYYEFLSIPYAKPPIGELRFKSPQSPEPWHDVRDATVTLLENKSLQMNIIDQTDKNLYGKEDCLYLNVYTPNIDTSKEQLLPVMVNIHGGGFVIGSGFKPDNGPQYLVENNVVVVSINYRLGVLGFLNLGIPEVSGKMGLKDQVKALVWVQENIHKFGGNKNNVTIFGVSAGSASVDYLILSPKAKGLFHKAIQHSGSSLNDWAINYEYDYMNKILLEQLGYKGDVTKKREMYKFLLEVPSDKILVAGYKTRYNAYKQKAVFFGFVPTIEKESLDAFLTKQPYKILKDGEFNKVPVIKGYCDKEGYIVDILKPVDYNEPSPKKDFMKLFDGFFLSEDLEKYNRQFLNIYTNTGENDSDEDLAIDFFGEFYFTAGVVVSANLTTENNVPTYLFEFKYDGNLNYFKKPLGLTKKGACHAEDGAYMFDKEELSDIKIDETDILVRSRITRMWTNFAKTGNPTPYSTPIHWPQYTEKNKAYLIIDKEFKIENRQDAAKMELFEEIYQKIAS